MPTLLIVEDDADLRHELSDYLSSLGYEVSGVGSIAAAEQLLHTPADLLLLDINLPDGSGLDFCLRVRPYVRAGIVVMTGRSERELRIQGLKGGADAYLVKPVDPEELEATLQSVLRRVDKHSYSLVQSAPLPVQWRVDSVRLTLSGPNAKVCKLSKGEFILLSALLLAKGQQVSRDTLLAAFEERGTPSNGRRMEAMISRLRGKVMEDMELELPIQSIYGQGYAFLDHSLVI